MKKTIAFIFSVVALLFLSTCTYKSFDPEVCFQTNILPIFITKCAMSGCHDGQGRVKYNLTNYDGIMAGVVPRHPLRSQNYTSIISVFGGKPSMPRKAPALSQKDVRLINAWISMGAQNTSNCISSCDTNSFTYSKTIVPILTTWCTGCHQSGNAGGGYDLSNYNGVVNSIAGNKLLGSIQHLVGYHNMPIGTKLSDCEITQIKKWVNAGYPNN